MSADNRDDEREHAAVLDRAQGAAPRAKAAPRDEEAEELLGGASARVGAEASGHEGEDAEDGADDAVEDGAEDGAEDAEATVAADGEALPEHSRKIRRRRRRTRPRSKTIAMKRLTREELRQGALQFPPVDVPRPTSRAECRSAEMRPCPWVACKHHLYLDINPETGSIKINFPDLEPWELKHTCALDVAEQGGITLEEVGEIMNLTRERIRQVEVRGLLKLKMGSPSPDELGAELLAGKVIDVKHLKN